MKQTWLAPANDVINAALKAGLKYIFNQEDAYVFAPSNDFKKLSKTNTLIIQRRNICTDLLFNNNFDAKLLENIHNLAYKNVKHSGFFENCTVIMQNRKTRKIKMFQLQPMSIMGLVVSLGVFDYSGSIKMPKLSAKLSDKEKRAKIIEAMDSQGFETETQISADFDLYETDGTIGEQFAKKYPEKEWEWLGPWINYHKIEIDFMNNWNLNNDRIDQILKITNTHCINQNVFDENFFNYWLRETFKKKMLEFAQTIINNEKSKKEKTKPGDILKMYVENNQYIPLKTLNEWEEEISKLTPTAKNKKEEK